MHLKLFLSAFVALFALVNPIHKILVITSLQSHFSEKELKYISLKSSLTALIILIFFLLLSEMIFNYIFHIQLYAFRIICGVVLIFNGLSGLQKGVLLNIDQNLKLTDVTTVPIAIPMIAGPATITAAVTFPAHYGRLVTIIAIVAALTLNLLIMLNSKKIGHVLIKYNFMNALIRITGLFVATIGLQMAFDGITNYIQTL
ncbi:MAG: MarC family protein [Bacteroidales bacterium]|nr:MarC family protein [Bacteroidales bacterium]